MAQEGALEVTIPSPPCARTVNDRKAFKYTLVT
jgi:hypothetical protein